MEAVLGVFGGALAIGAFFGVLAIWVVSTGELKKKQREREREAREREFQHPERLKALEAGFPLPDADLAEARADRVRAGVAGAIGIAVPAVAAGCAVAGTALVLTLAQPHLHLPLLCTIWPMSGVVGLVAVSKALRVLSRGASRRPEREGPPPRKRLPPDVPATAVTERIDTL